MKKIFIFIVSVFSYLFHTQATSLSLLPLGEEKEKQRYIFRSLNSIEKQQVWVYGDSEEYGFNEEEFDECVDSAFYERGLDPESNLMRDEVFPASASLKIQIMLHRETVIISVGLLSEALLLESQVFVPAIIWQERTILRIEGEKQKIKQDLLTHIKKLVGHFLDEYLYARKGD